MTYHSWMVPRRSPLYDKFKMDLMWMWDSGVKNMLEGAPPEAPKIPKLRENMPLDLVQTAPMFLILAMGVAMAIVTFVTEYCAGYCGTKNNAEISDHEMNVLN